MGRDKALLPLADGRLLWQRQISLLESLAPAELFFSGPRREGIPAGLRVLEDAVPSLGPLSGLVLALESMAALRLVALAVDLPEMTSGFLQGLLDRSAAGAIPYVNGRLEPLAAIYPADALPLARKRLEGEDRSMQGFVAAAVDAGILERVDVLAADARLFTNWNHPGDYRPEVG